MKPNASRNTDVAAGFILAACISPALLYYAVAAIQISSGHFVEQSYMSGIVATDIPRWLSQAKDTFLFAFPAILAYIVWMLCHRYAGAHPSVSVALAVVVSLMSGLPVLNATLFDVQEIPMAVTSGVALLVCVGLAIVELRQRRRPALSDGLLANH